MKFIKNNILSITAMVFLFTLVMIDPAAAENLGSGSVFTSAKSKLNQLLKNLGKNLRAKSKTQNLLCSLSAVSA